MSHLTEQAIKASFIRLLNERPFARITVQDIVKDCGINRNTFYYHYHDIPQLLEEIALDSTNSLIASYPDIASLEECVDAAFGFVLENRRAIGHIYHSLNREVFERYLMRICEYSVSRWFDTAFAGVETGERDRERIQRFIRFELFGAAIAWMNEGMPQEAVLEAKQILSLCYDSVSRLGLV